MLHDELFMNIETGELLPGQAAIHDFYTVEKHTALESWTDTWKPTGEQANTYISKPDFIKAITI